jgi:putative transposase
VQYVNRTYRRTGTLWEGRFRSCLTQSEDYVLACYRYIELNPVRVGMVVKPQDYRWSSYYANGLGRASALLTSHVEYRRLGRGDTERREAYRALFRAHVDEALPDEIRDATNGNFVLGDPRFQNQIAQALGRRVARGKAGRPVKQEDVGDERPSGLL